MTVVIDLEVGPASDAERNASIGAVNGWVDLPAGSFTTAAAMVACVEKILKEKHQRRLDGLKLAIFGATGVVGFASAVIAALERSSVTIVGYDGIKRVADSANEIRTRFNVEVRPADGSIG